MSGPAQARTTRQAWSGAGRIRSGADVTRVLAAVLEQGGRRERTADMLRVVDRADDIALTAPNGARTLPVAPELAELLSLNSKGVRRGTTVAVTGSTSLLFALLATPMAQGAWAAIVGMPDLSAAAAIEYGIDLARLALIPRPGDRWAEAVAALVDGLDVVVVATPGEVPDRLARSLMARARQRGCVLVPTRPWPGCEMTLRLARRDWLGLGHGRGRLRLQKITVEASGRGRAVRPRRAEWTLPPSSITKRVGAGREPGSALPFDPARNPDRVHDPIVVSERLHSVPAPNPDPDPWREIFRQPITAGQARQRAG